MLCLAVMDNGWSVTAYSRQRFVKKLQAAKKNRRRHRSLSWFPGLEEGVSALQPAMRHRNGNLAVQDLPNCRLRVKFLQLCLHNRKTSSTEPVDPGSGASPLRGSAAGPPTRGRCQVRRCWLYAGPVVPLRAGLAVYTRLPAPVRAVVAVDGSMGVSNARG